MSEVLALQGAPLMGALLAMRELTGASSAALLALIIGNGLLVAHVFMINDWAGIESDLRDPHRAARTFIARGFTRQQIGFYAVTLLAAALAVFASLGPASLGVAVVIAGLSALYSTPGIHMKGRPGFSSALHLLGGALHFVLGYIVFAPLGLQALVVSSVFGLVFTAGHFTHEARDHEGDALNSIRTNAVVMGRRSGLIAGFLCFSVAYGLLFFFALAGTLPRALIIAAPLYLLHAVAFASVVRHGLSFSRLRRLQHLYRILFALIGLALAVGAVQTWDWPSS
ncbi:UbiA family prenyltransferase [Brevundimonas naejangsanensis]|uniref:UbiA family prenyltransferase n=1 Tax=Brevundimonas naejangsanensis TaxID=588932 RepID=UPI003D00531D